MSPLDLATSTPVAPSLVDSPPDPEIPDPTKNPHSMSGLSEPLPALPALPPPGQARAVPETDPEVGSKPSATMSGESNPRGRTAQLKEPPETDPGPGSKHPAAMSGKSVPGGATQLKAPPPETNPGPPKHPAAMSGTSVPAGLIYCNGVNAMTGTWDREPMLLDQFAKIVRQEKIPLQSGKEPGVRINAEALNSAGWAVIFPENVDPQVREALEPLLARRRAQAGPAFREFTYRSGLTANQFLGSQGAAFNPADPALVPYYVLLVGPPTQIPFTFQQQLDVRYAVGRLDFATIEEYEHYAQAVVQIEENGSRRPKKVAFFAAQHPQDEVTRMSVEQLVKPLADLMQKQPGWQVEVVAGAEATKPQLTAFLGGEKTPALLFAANHAVTFEAKHPEHQRHYQGALLCSEWPGPEGWEGPIPREHFFSASDLGSAADVSGLVTVQLGCFTVGTPQLDSFDRSQQREVAKHPFTARLPQRLLERGALAVIGHVDSLYHHSFVWPQTGPKGQHQTFEALTTLLLNGASVGVAMETLGRRHSEIGTSLLAAVLNLDGNSALSDSEYVALWTGYHDARNYVLLGDPAVRLSV